MPIYNAGIVPAQVPYGAELVAVTRRGFLPYFFVQIYNSSPVLAAFLANAKPTSGGVSSITAPVQGLPMTTSQWTNYEGGFDIPTQQQGAFPAEFNLKALITPITYLGMEGALQLDHAVVPLLEARMNDAGNNGAAMLQTALYGNTSNAQQLIGFPGAIDDGTNTSSYGNISRGNSWWVSKQYAAGSIAPTRKLVMHYLLGVQKYGGEVPTFGVCGPGTWSSLGDDFITNESFQVRPGEGFDTQATKPRSGFRALDVGGTPIYVDVGCPEGLIYLVNSRYMALHVHDQANFSLSDFDSMLSNGVLGYIAVVLTLCELVNVKPVAQGFVTGLTYNTL
jgi:hypothetical protein